MSAAKIERLIWYVLGHRKAPSKGHLNMSIDNNKVHKNRSWTITIINYIDISDKI
jgi:hypothetical protein